MLSPPHETIYRDRYNIGSASAHQELLDVGSSSDGDSLVLSPGHEAVGNGQVPQALPGQAHEGSTPASSASAASSVVTAPVASQSAVAPSPLSSTSDSPPTGSPNPSATTSAVSLTSSPSSAQSTSSITPSPVSETQSTPTTPSSSDSALPSPSSDAAHTPSQSSSSLSSTLSSVQSSPTSAGPTAAAINNSRNGHGAPFWVGISLIAVAGVAAIIALFIWWLRIRKRSSRRPWETRWRWGRLNSYRFPDDAVSASGAGASWWQPHGDRDVGEPRRSTSNLPSPQMAACEPTLPAIAMTSPFSHGPYPTLRRLPLELRPSDSSVPGIVQDIGSLQVANLVAGDILTSGDESSRPTTVLDDVGTPRELSAMFKPRYLSLNGSGGLDVPWAPTPPPEQSPLQEQALNTTAPLNPNRWKERLEGSATQNAEPLTQGPQPGVIETWRDSLRNNIASAFGAFTATAPARPDVTTYDWRMTTPMVMRAASVASTTSKPWSLEETHDGAGVVHIRDVPAAPASVPSLGSTPLPTPPGLRSPPTSALIPPRLPHLPPPAVPRTSGSSRSVSTRRLHGSRHQNPLVRSPSSSARSATSVGSEMSRASGAARWSRLSEKEEAARRALRQRRRRSVSTARRRTRSSVRGGALA
ncbi:hypothetical protein BC834DRAFT_971804 [Gloeopeniophorella convolvens]|nr:hypothetical protein BC834DRAFT_971804 [Gloeopeniophorella convolvens]